MTKFLPSQQAPRPADSKAPCPQPLEDMPTEAPGLWKGLVAHAITHCSRHSNTAMPTDEKDVWGMQEEIKELKAELGVMAIMLDVQAAETKKQQQIGRLTNYLAVCTSVGSSLALALWVSIVRVWLTDES
ncbi:hypothetical protein B0T22DRAFT_440835 [Podospora appendiculata]|uniref:Transmembrane protein n=1 Tax=Podospora appendiculata TaxID=314037 RepID=A0AAE0XBU8_9PEZI|nr:hypothetical protein B0T22DRAFT_440835 [Podospora appendiculata]